MRSVVIANRASGEVLPPEDPVERLARVLHAKMEHLDPTDDPDWESLTEQQREFYRLCIEALLRRRDLLDAAKSR